MAVPQRRDAAFLPLTGEEGVQGGFDVIRIRSDEFVGAYGAGLGAFRVVAQGDAGHTHHGGLLGDAAAVGDYGLGTLHQIVELQIAHGLYNMEVFGMDAQFMEDLRRARVNGEHDGQAMHIGDDFVHQPFQLLGLVHVGGTVHGKGQVLLRLQLQFVINSRLDKSGAVGQQGVDHHVANEEQVLLPHPETA